MKLPENRFILFVQRSDRTRGSVIQSGPDRKFLECHVKHEIVNSIPCATARSPRQNETEMATGQRSCRAARFAILSGPDEIGLFLMA